MAINVCVLTGKHMSANADAVGYPIVGTTEGIYSGEGVKIWRVIGTRARQKWKMGERVNKGRSGLTAQQMNPDQNHRTSRYGNNALKVVALNCERV